MFRLSLVLILPLLFAGAASAQKNKGGANKGAANEEDKYYKLLTFATPAGEVLEAGAIEMMPDGKVAVGTRRGEIWMIENALDPDPEKAKFTRFAHGLHEILGLAQKDGWVYVTHRPDVSRLKDTNGDGKADLFEIVSDGWEVSGDYHEYAFGTRFDAKGRIWFALCLTGSFNSNVKYRGWAGYVTENGKFVPTTSGVRSPGGVGFNPEGDVFYTDNQGPWNGTCGLKCLTVGGFVGHPDSFKWYAEPEAKYLGEKPVLPKSGSRQMVEAKKIPQFYPTCVMFPYAKMGNSASGIDFDGSAGKFGPFEKQLFVGDQTASTVMRVSLEKVNGKYQGACYPFRQGFSCGIVPLRFAADGSLFAGGTSRGWGSKGTKPFSVERLVWTGKVPFEIREMKATPYGFDLTFTKPVDPAAAGNATSYVLKTFTYKYQSDYGSPEVDQTTPKITSVVVASDKKSVRLVVDGLQEGHIHDLTTPGVRSADGEAVLHPQAYYTLNYIPVENKQ
jgi:glucose/arabinose dehydrogenase